MNTSPSAPIHVLRYCPRCAGALAPRDNGRSFLCAACGFQFFINAAAAVCVLIEDDQGHLLLTRRGREPGAGLLDLPGGFVEPLERIEDAARREIKEELNLELTGLTYLTSEPNRYAYGGLTYFTLDMAFLARAADLRVLAAGDDVSGALFLPPAQISLEQIAFASIRAILRYYLKQRGIGCNLAAAFHPRPEE